MFLSCEVNLGARAGHVSSVTGEPARVCPDVMVVAVGPDPYISVTDLTSK